MKSAFTLGYWFGFAYFACNLSWIGNALLIDAQHFGWLYPIALLSSGAFFGLFVAFPAMLCRYFKNIYAQWLSFSAFWVVFEWIRSFIFTGFPWNLLGSVLAFSTPALQLASIIGTYGLSLLVLMQTSAISILLCERNKKNIINTASIIISTFVLIWGYGYIRLQPSELKNSETIIRIVQPAIPQTMKWKKSELENNFKEYIKLSQQSGFEKINFVIWGETATPFALDFEPEKLKEITQAVPPHGYLLTGLVRYQYTNHNFSPVNSMFIIDSNGKILDFYDKSHLVPFGEYIPFRQYLPSWIRPVTNAIANFVPGNGPKVIKIPQHPSVGGLICYEIIFPSQIVNSKNRPEWLVNLTNDGWYGTSQGPYQHLVATQLRAVEEGISIIRAANTGISAAISPYGEILKSIPLNQKGIIDINLPKPSSIQTIYGYLGNILPLILCLINIMLSFFIQKKNT